MTGMSEDVRGVDDGMEYESGSYIREASER
jgi:hypothetical protein